MATADRHQPDRQYPRSGQRGRGRAVRRVGRLRCHGVHADGPGQAGAIRPRRITDVHRERASCHPGGPEPHNALLGTLLGRPPANTTVWRFYNAKKNTHFYTANEAEKNNVVATLSRTFQLEGVGYTIRSAAPANAAPLHRFFNRKTGTHFYTVDPAEKTRVETTLASTYTYEGIAYYVASGAATGATPVYRFFNKKNQTHFYTADPAEKATRAEHALASGSSSTESASIWRPSLES